MSNGFCTDSIVKNILLDNKLKAGFQTGGILCPEDAAVFKNNSTGAVTNYWWNFGNGYTYTQETPSPQKYPVIGAEKVYTAQLVVENSAHCFDTATARIKVLRTCYIAVPNAFTPNNDGVNDYLYPLNAFKADNLEFNVYNRLGQLVFHSSDWTQKWDGKLKGSLQSTGTYAWMLRYTDHDSGQKVFLKGTSVLVR
ncbi:MAG: gliding motility-associated C-terminal domain-containing protein [Chitinophagaceae bacterium]